MYTLSGTVNFKDDSEKDIPAQRCALEWTVGEVIAEIIKQQEAKGATSYIFVVAKVP